MDKAQLTAVFEWMTIINIGILIMSTALLIGLRRITGPLHAKLFGLEVGQVALTGYVWLGSYKILIIVFNIVPYIALQLS